MNEPSYLQELLRHAAGLGRGALQGSTLGLADHAGAGLLTTLAALRGDPVNYQAALETLQERDAGYQDMPAYQLGGLGGVGGPLTIGAQSARRAAKRLARRKKGDGPLDAERLAADDEQVRVLEGELAMRDRYDDVLEAWTNRAEDNYRRSNRPGYYDNVPASLREYAETDITANREAMRLLNRGLPLEVVMDHIERKYGAPDVTILPILQDITPGLPARTSKRKRQDVERRLRRLAGE